MYEYDRRKLINDLKVQRRKLGLINEILPEDAKHNVRLLDCLIYTNYNCRHENVICDSEDLDNNCICLDCGDIVNPRGSKYRLLYNTKDGDKLVDVRRKYLASLLTKDTDSTISELENEGTLKLRRENIFM